MGQLSKLGMSNHIESMKITWGTGTNPAVPQVPHPLLPLRQRPRLLHKGTHLRSQL